MISRGALYHLLQNRLYIGEIVHRDQSHPGQHPPILDPELFAKVQRRLEANRRRRREAKASADAARPLTGKLYDVEGDPMSPTVSQGRSGRSYRYYVSACLQAGVAPAAAPCLAPRRLPAKALEQFIYATIQRLAGRSLDENEALGPMLRRIDVRPTSAELVLDAKTLFGRAHGELALTALRKRLGAGEEAVWEEGDRTALRVHLPVRLKFRGGRRGVIDEADRQAKTDPALVKALRTAHRTLRRLNASPFLAISELLEAQSPPTLYLRRLVRLAFLAPDLQHAILDGRQPRALTLAAFLKADPPLGWDAQRRWWRSL